MPSLDMRRRQGKADSYRSKCENSGEAFSVTVQDSLLQFGFIQIKMERAAGLDLLTVVLAT